MPGLRLDECFRELGLRSSAGGAEIKRAFRKLAKTHHPDLQHAQADRERFVRILEAYKRLQTELRLHADDGDSRPCPSCGQVAELFDGADGRVACIDCLLGMTRRRSLLPVPSVTTVRHGAVIGLEAVSVYCLCVTLVRGSPEYAAVSLLTGLTALLLLAVTCVCVKYVKP